MEFSDLVCEVFYDNRKVGCFFFGIIKMHEHRYTKKESKNGILMQLTSIALLSNDVRLEYV